MFIGLIVALVALAAGFALFCRAYPKAGGAVAAMGFLAIGGCNLKNYLADDKRVDQNTPVALQVDAEGNAVFRIGSKPYELRDAELMPLPLDHDVQISKPKFWSLRDDGVHFREETSQSGRAGVFTQFEGQRVDVRRVNQSIYDNGDYVAGQPQDRGFAFGLVKYERILFMDTPQALFHVSPQDAFDPTKFDFLMTQDRQLGHYQLWGKPKAGQDLGRIWVFDDQLGLVETIQTADFPKLETAAGYGCFSCGCSCYQDARIYAHNGKYFVHVFGYPLVPKLRGVYQLDTSQAPAAWRKRVAGNLSGALAMSPDGCKLAYTIVSKSGDKPLVADICPLD